VNLELQPYSRARAKVTREPHSGVDSDGAFPVNDLADTDWGNANVVGKAILGERERFHEVF
jgi:hypothetical protein